ncbi:copper resistance system multicopper oxidase [Rhodovarius lipocyclicus]|uniref:copper resistance system multicopper oxidase n=1 Tax=Rhodovarius lipocyclicus TaxID=268410 RepID=UPI00135B232E|nr:copper resistance system multicopper oxidase [Rhodovarius lipocyclicus]
MSLSRRDSLRLAGGMAAAGTIVAYPGRRSFAAADEQIDLAVERTRITVDGVTSDAISIGGSVPAPTLRWREGQEVVIRVVNRLNEPTSIHWHGLLLAGVMDGAPGFNGYVAIPPGGTYTYRFRLRQSGTYWYHSHSAGQEQAGMYGAIVIEPARPEALTAARDYVVFLSDHSRESPTAIFRNLRAREGYYNRGQRTFIDFLRDSRRDGLGATIRDRLDWGEMRMDPTDLADVTGYQFLVNGQGTADNWTGLFTPGERVRLRIINGSAMSIFDVALPDLRMLVVGADGMPVLPMPVDEFRIGIGETYDVIVTPPEARAYTIMAEPVDRSGYARATLAPRAGMSGPIPPLRPRTVLTMSDMGMAHGGGGHAGHSMPMGASGSADPHAGHAMPMGAAVSIDPHAGHSMAAMPGMADGRTMGWTSAGTPPGKRALRYADLRSTVSRPSAPAPSREILVRLTGQMNRYIWTIDGRPFGMEDPVRAREGERIRLRFMNETMMAHPMHLHGMFMELENGAGNRLPYKHVILVPPGSEASALLTANEVGEWPFHCHLLFHMEAGMMTRFIVEPTRVGGAG